MPYVERKNGKIVSVYENPQPGFADEFLAETHADMVVFRSPPVTVQQVKAEAGRRILEIAPEWKQRNLTARAAEFALKLADGGSLDAAEGLERDAGQEIWDAIKAIRAKSNEIEAMNPIPTDYADDGRWV
ncbi:MAG: hypothetical protein MK041_13165 [Aquabacterium sp.]|nr:hypothetical protein [Aquabacterium sp.]